MGSLCVSLSHHRFSIAKAFSKFSYESMRLCQLFDFIYTRAFPSLAIVSSLFLVACTQGSEEGSPEESISSENGKTLRVAGFHDDEAVHLFFRYYTGNPSWYHQYWVYQDGEWVRLGSGAEGPDPYGFYEDRISILWGDGSVVGFAEAGGMITLHSGMRSTRSAVDPEEVKSHPHLGETLGRSDVRKFIRESRQSQSGEPLWKTVRSAEELQQLREDGRFLDLWQWRAHRSNPVGYADNGYVLDYRHNSVGRSMFTDNVDPETGRPLKMYDFEKTGLKALRFEKLRDKGYTQEDLYFLEESFAVPFDADHQWAEGDALPHRLLRKPDGSRGAIRAEGIYKDGAWHVYLKRSLQSPEPLDSLTFEKGKTYDAAFAVHTDSTGARHHNVSLPIKVGFGVDADLTLNHRTEANPAAVSDLDWISIPLFDPGDPTR